MPISHKNPSVMKHDFSKVPHADIQRSSFSRDHRHLTTMDAGMLVPILVDEALPGDTFNINTTAFGRLNTPAVPFMDNLYLDTFFFAVPNRLLWDNWEKFQGEQTNPGDSTDYLVPTITAPLGGFGEQSIYDYMGIPTKVAGLEVNSLHMRAYNLIYNEWFRDQNLIDSITINTGDGPDAPTDYTLKRRGKRHDYFTSCLPFVQKGDAVSLPLGTTAPIETDAAAGTSIGIINNSTLDSTNALYAGATNVEATAATANDSDRIYVNLSDATAATINQLREAFQVQRMLERDARGGTRYVEMIKAHFGVTSPDARMQRPEYLGGGTSAITVTPVAQTSSTDATTPKGDLSGFGTVLADRSNGFNKSFTEHCVIIGIACVRADLNYQQGLNRMWSRQTRLDYYLPVLAHLGEQAVLNKEIYAQGTSADDDVFGYNERWSEYRYKPSTVTGLMRSNASASLDVWHLSQDFSSLPVLNEAFIEENPPVDRVVSVTSQPDFKMDFYFTYRCHRPMPMYSVPGFTDHF